MLYSDYGVRTMLPQQGRGDAAEEEEEGREEKPRSDSVDETFLGGFFRSGHNGTPVRALVAITL